MVNPLGHWLWILFGTRFRIPLRGLSGFRGVGLQIPLKGLSGFWVTPGLVVTVETYHVEITSVYSHRVLVQKSTETTETHPTRNIIDQIPTIINFYAPIPVTIKFYDVIYPTNLPV